jgi:hypothetical protein
MFQNIQKCSLVLAVIFLINACAANKNPSDTGTDVHKPVTNQAFFDQILAQPQFTNLKINSKINVQNDQFVPTLDATIYIENQNKVWMNLVAVLFNVARGQATKDGIKGYDKINKTYIDSDFEYLNHMLNVDFVDYSALQNIILGRTFVPVNAADFTLTKNAQGYALTSKKAQNITTNGKVSSYNMAFNFNPETDLTHVLVTNEAKNESLQVEYSNWTNVENLRLPKNVKIIIKGSKDSQILMENTTFAFTRMETPFTIPGNYTKSVIK